MDVLSILQENTQLQLILAAVFAFVAFAWLVNAIVETRDRADRRRAEEAKLANAPKVLRAKRGGSSGKMFPLGAVWEATKANRENFEGYELIPSEKFAEQVRGVSQLFNEQHQTEWLWFHDADGLTAACDFIEKLGFAEIADKLRGCAPYQALAHRYAQTDQDPPDNTPEETACREIFRWLDETDAWRPVAEKANAVLESDYPWSDSREV